MSQSNTQPEWLQEVIMGLSSGHRFKVFLEGKKYAVIVCAGHTEYANRGTGNAYCPTEYILVEKGKNYWSHVWQRIHQGRMTKAKRPRLEQLLAMAEKKGFATVRKHLKIG